MMGYLAAGKALAVISARSTHRVFASLNHPLFAARKEGSYIYYFVTILVKVNIQTPERHPKLSGKQKKVLTIFCH